MQSQKSHILERINHNFRSLELGRKLSCTLIKQYANIKNSKLNELIPEQSEETEESLLHKIHANNNEALEDLRALEEVINAVNDDNMYNKDATVKDYYRLWRSDVALRLTLTMNLPRYNVTDLQRLLFVWLDGPFIKDVN